MKKYLKYMAVAVFCLLSASQVYAQNKTLNQKPFSDFRVNNKTYYFSGQLGLSKDEGPADIDFNTEVRQCMNRIADLLKQNKLKFKEVVQVTVYLNDMDNFEEFNSIYIEYFSSPYPSRACVAVSQLYKNARVEISFIAAKD
ncbi:RidA family protein [Fulvivirga sediminis]|uniref:RidA family protein n=1 Tax=Fulvivirga sediminis TaxID=2803949 RepID=A0A937K193_9BACT|nr:RidA family protein [Fulvivirga sediminis]MBL3657221.1 RidA family protein [Fulvivirga sediminis]